MTLEQLDTVLRYVFGCHGYDGRCRMSCASSARARRAAAYIRSRRTRSSTTSRASTPGIYHYNARDHELVLLSELEPAEGRRMATSFMCGQSYFGTAHVSFVLTARFYRNHWKYRRHQKAYAAILMDAAHLSQTLYLVSAELGLGAFITIAHQRPRHRGAPGARRR